MSAEAIVITPGTSAEWAAAFAAAHFYLDRCKAEPQWSAIDRIIAFDCLSARARSLVLLGRVLEQPIEKLNVELKGPRA